MGVTAKIRLWQTVFLAGSGIGFYAGQESTVGTVFGAACLVLFFAAVAIVGWVRQGQRNVSRRRG